MNDNISHVPLYEGTDLALDYYDGGHPVSIVTFEARDEERDSVTPRPFGEGFGLGRFAALGMNEFVVKRSRNHWYQTEEIFEVIELIYHRSVGTRVFTYGGSMGAFAAINFASKLQAEKFIALSPLYDVSMGNKLGDVRWASDSAHIDFKYNLLKEGGCRDSDGYVFYCAKGPDRAHAELIADTTKAKLVPFEYGGHPISFLLNETYGLKAIVEEIASDQFDPDLLTSVVTEKASQTYYPYERAALDFDAVGMTQDAIDSIRQPIRKNSKVQKLHLRLANLLLKANDLPGAEEALKAAIEVSPKQAQPYARLSHIYSKRGDLKAAIEQMQLAIKLNPDIAVFHGGLGELLLKTNDMLGAEVAFRKATDIDPKRVNPHVRLSRIYADRNEVRAAIKHMRVAVQLEPKSSAFHRRLGELLLKVGDQVGAEKAFGIAMELKSERPRMGERPLLRQRKIEGARRSFSKMFRFSSILDRLR